MNRKADFLQNESIRIANRNVLLSTAVEVDMAPILLQKHVDIGKVLLQYSKFITVRYVCSFPRVISPLSVVDKLCFFSFII